MCRITNYHSHCNYCDGKGSIESFIIAAIDSGLKAYGISTHSPLPFPAPWVIKSTEVDNYIAEIADLKIKYASQIEVLTGMEIDYLDSTYNPSTPYFQGLNLDYRIGSVHFVRSERDGSFVDVDCPTEDFFRSVNGHFGGSLERIVRGYYKASSEMIEAGGFDFIGHADKISANSSALSSHIMDKPWYKELADDFLVLCAKRDVRLEVNTKAWEGHGIFFPNERYFKRIAELGIAIVVNSDAHRTTRITSGLSEAIDRLHKAGVERIEEFSNGVWSLRQFE